MQFFFSGRLDCPQRAHPRLPEQERIDRMASTPLNPPSQLSETPPRPARETAKDAVRTLIRWAGDGSTREGLPDTPARVSRHDRPDRRRITEQYVTGPRGSAEQVPGGGS